MLILLYDFPPRSSVLIMTAANSSDEHGGGGKPSTREIKHESMYFLG